MSAPTGKWRKARRQLLSHRSFHSFDLEGQGAGARQEKRKHLFLSGQANEEKRGCSSSATVNAFVCDELAQEQYFPICTWGKVINLTKRETFMDKMVSLLE